MSWMRSGTKLSQFLRDFLPALSCGDIIYRIDVRLRRHVPAGFTPYILAIRSKETGKIILDFHAKFSR